MKKIKKLCLIAALGVMVTGGGLLQSTTVYAATQDVKGGMNLKSIVESAKAGDVINVIGTVKSDTINVPSGVIVSGKKGAGKVDFSLTGTTKKGFVVNGTGSTISDLEVYNAGDNGVYMEGSKNNLTNLNVHNNNDAGVQLSNGASNNTLTLVYSHDNCDQYKDDKTKLGENADGFAIKLHSGAGNKLIECTAEGNSDDGYDLYAAHGAVSFYRCKAINNGAFKTSNGKVIYGDGNGFKLGGVDNKTPGVKAHMDPLAHYLEGCIASGNLKAGFDRNNQNGVVTMKGCTGENNKEGNYRWPLTGAPSALINDGVIKDGEKVTFGKAIIENCKSIGGGKNDISGATLVNSPTVK